MEVPGSVPDQLQNREERRHLPHSVVVKFKWNLSHHVLITESGTKNMLKRECPPLSQGEQSQVEATYLFTEQNRQLI